MDKNSLLTIVLISSEPTTENERCAEEEQLIGSEMNNGTRNYFICSLEKHSKPSASGINVEKWSFHFVVVVIHGINQKLAITHYDSFSRFVHKTNFISAHKNVLIYINISNRWQITNVISLCAHSDQS